MLHNFHFILIMVKYSMKFTNQSCRYCQNAPYDVPSTKTKSKCHLTYIYAIIIQFQGEIYYFGNMRSQIVRHLQSRVSIS